MMGERKRGRALAAGLLLAGSAIGGMLAFHARPVRAAASTCWCGGDGITDFNGLDYGDAFERDEGGIVESGCVQCGGSGYRIRSVETGEVTKSHDFVRGSGSGESDGRWFYGASGWRRDLGSGEWYFYGSDGNPSKGWVHFEPDTGYSSSWHYFDPNSGQMLRKRFFEENGEWYYLRSDGCMAVGEAVIENSNYYFHEDGRMARGVTFYDGNYYYYKNAPGDKRDGVLEEGWISADGTYYYADPVTGVLQLGIQVINGKTYYFYEDGESIGKMARGWASNNGKMIYLKDAPGEGDDGVMQVGWLNIGGYRYYLDETTGMRKGWQKIGDHWYYLEPKGTSDYPLGSMHVGWTNADEEWYYFEPAEMEGYPQGSAHVGWTQVGGDRYYLEPNTTDDHHLGKRYTGWLDLNGNRYYLDEKTGAMHRGWWEKPNSDEVYYFKNAPGQGDDGVMQKDKYVDGWYLDLNGIRRNVYTVSYDPNGGSGSMEPQKTVYTKGVRIQENLFVRKGYTFREWMDSNDKTYHPGETAYNLTKQQNGVVVLYAQWNPNPYWLTLDPNGGSVGQRVKMVYYDSPYGTLPVPIRRGYTFLGWYTKSAGGTQVTAETKVDVAGDHVLYAHWKINQYKVIYDANGGSGVSKASDVVTYDTAVDLSVTAEKDGRVFIGWARSADAKEGLSSLLMPAMETVDTPLVLYALYSIPVSDVKEVYLQSWPQGKKEQYRVWQLEKTGEDDELGYLRGYTYALPETDISAGEGVVTDWAVTALDNAGNKRILAQSATPMEMQWFQQTVEHYKEDALSGEWVWFATTSEPVLKGMEYDPQYLDPIPPGYEKDHMDGSGPYLVEGEKVTRAYYRLIPYTLHFDPNGGICEDGQDRPVKYGAPYGPLPAASRLGWRFLGWFTGVKDGTRVDAEMRYGILGDSTLYAHWEANVHNVYYDFATNGGDAASNRMAQVAYGNAVDLSVTAEKEGWEHVGWNTDPDATVGLVGECLMPDSDLTLYAIYKKVLTVTYQDWGKDAPVCSTEDITIYNRAVSGMATIPELAGRDGFVAAGWSLGEAGDSEIDAMPGMEISVAEDLYFYGRYQRTITAKYDTGDEKQQRDAQSGTQEYNASGNYVDPQFVLADAPEKEGNSFVGWGPKGLDGDEFGSDGPPIEPQKDAYSPGETVCLSEDVLFVAIWDEYPEITAYDRYFTLGQAQGGEVTEELLLEGALAEDLEDGALEKRLGDSGSQAGDGLRVVGWQEEDFKGFTSEGSVSVTYQATDSFGNHVEKTIMAYIVDAEMREVTSQSYLRFISDRFYKDGEGYVPQEQGGLAEDSIWKEEGAYQEALDSALGNAKTGVEDAHASFLGKDYSFEKPGSGSWAHELECWKFGHEAVEAVKSYMQEVGYEHYKDAGAFYEKFQEYREPSR